jgi:RND family efflux transporter MFP subunit
MINTLASLSTPAPFAGRLTLAAVFLVISGCGEEVVEQVQVVRPIKILTVCGPAGGRVVRYPGEVRPVQNADLAFEVAGRMIELPVVEGEDVQAGQHLASVDPADFQSAVNQAQADYDAAASTFERYETLFASGTVSAQDFDVARRNAEVAAAQLETAMKALNDTRLLAPFAGRVSRRYLDNFSNVQAKQAVILLQDLSSLEVLVNVPEQDWQRAAPGRTLEERNARISPQVSISSAPGRSFPAVITEFSTAADPVTRTFQGRVRFDPPEDISLLPGMTAEVSFEMLVESADLDTAVWVPSAAVLADDLGNATVWIVDAVTMRVSQTVVEAGALSGSDMRILGGLETGDRIAISGVHNLREGMEVSELSP